MTPPCHPWLAAALDLYIIAAVTISFWGFLHKRPETSVSLRDQIIAWMRGTLASFEPLLLQLGLRPDHLTFTQLGFSVFAGAAYAMGNILIGGWFMLGCGVLDLLDGGLARRMAQVTRRGAFFDSVTDRYAEFFTFSGLGVFFADSWMLWIVAWGLIGSLMVSYARARAEGLGVECQGGLMQRGERYVLLGGGSLFSTIWNHLFCQHTHSILVASLVLLAILSNLTALSRIRAVAVTLKEP
jgi:phosphatidylglycerophosphate synthase